MASDILIVVGLGILALAAIIFIPWWQVKRTLPKVIRTFRENNALDARSAKSISELGLQSRGMLGGMFRGRDYRQHALGVLMRAEIVQTTSDGRLFLVEGKLLETGLEGRKAYYN